MKDECVLEKLSQHADGCGTAGVSAPPSA